MTNDEINDAVTDFSAYLHANGVDRSVVFVASVLDDGSSVGHSASIYGFNKAEVIGIFSVQLHERIAEVSRTATKPKKSKK